VEETKLSGAGLSPCVRLFLDWLIKEAEDATERERPLPATQVELSSKGRRGDSIGNAAEE